VQADRPKGCIISLLLGVSVDVDGCGVQDLCIKLSQLEFSFIVDAVRHYKHSVQSVVQSHTIVDDSDVGMEPTPDSSAEVC
jgi:hypothetical protein